jgi:hypothetical protein
MGEATSQPVAATVVTITHAYPIRAKGCRVFRRHPDEPPTDGIHIVALFAASAYR